MALEHPGPGFNGLVGDVAKDTSLYNLSHFVGGYGVCQRDYSLTEIDKDWEEFLEWLRPQGYFPTAGWAWKIIEECGDGDAAFNRFSELLFGFLEDNKPKWFIEYNLEPQPSYWYSIDKKPKAADIRMNKHIEIANA